MADLSGQFALGSKHSFILNEAHSNCLILANQNAVFMVFKLDTGSGDKIVFKKIAWALFCYKTVESTL